MDPFSGLYDLFVQKKLLNKEGNKWSYTCLDGTQIKQFEKPWSRNEDGCLERVMNEFHAQMGKRYLHSEDVPDTDTSAQESE
jgi:hypothetical protein